MSRPTHTEVQPHAFIGESAWITKDGATGVVIRLHPFDSECMEPVEIAATTDVFKNAVRTFGPKYTVYQYLVKRRCIELRGSDTGRNEYLLRKGLYGFGVYIVVVRDGIHCAEVETAAESFCQQVSESLRAEVAGRDEAYSLFRRLLNYDQIKAESVGLNHDEHLAYWASDSDIEVHRGALVVGDHWVKVLSLKDPPKATSPDLLKSLREVDSECIVVTEWRVVETQAAQDLIKTKVSHFHRTKYDSGNSAMSAATKLASSEKQQETTAEMQKDQGAAAMEAQLGDLQKDMEKNGTQVGQFALTVILFDLNRDKAEGAAAGVFKAMAKSGATFFEEKHNTLGAWFAALPGGRKHQLRSMLLTDANYADLSMLFAPDTGNPVNEYLKAECLAVVETRQKTPFYLNLNYGDGDVFHTAFIGQTGSGKSYTASWLIGKAIERYGARIVIFDKGGSYRNLTAAHNGSYMDLGINNKFTMAPFDMEQTDENLIFHHAFVRNLMAMNGYRMEDPRDDGAIEGGIKTLYGRAKDERRLCHLDLPERLGAYLDKWRGSGRYASLFDNAVDTLTTNDVQTFDFENLDKYKEVVQPFLFYIFHRISEAVASEPDRFKVILVDECWKFLANDSAREYIHGAFKTLRKRKAAVWIATQSLEDLVKSGMDETVTENCASFVFLPNPGMKADAYSEAFHLNTPEVDAILRMRAKREWLLKRQTGSKILCLNS